MRNYADLEIDLRHQGGDTFEIDLRFSDAKGVIDKRLNQNVAAKEPVLVTIKQEELQKNIGDDSAYGKFLSDCLFSNPRVHEFYAQAKAKVPLRLRLVIEPQKPPPGAKPDFVPEFILHDVHWEKILDPIDLIPICTNDQFRFSRYLSIEMHKEVLERPRSELRALAVIANPNDLGQCKPQGRSLTPLNVPEELERIHKNLVEPLGSRAITTIASGGKATIDNIMKHLRNKDKDYDILYLVCHGAMAGEPLGPSLWLEKETGEADIVSVDTFVDRIKALEKVPRLVVLASCQSGGSGKEGHAPDKDPMMALGPRLVSAGIAAVLAMQGDVTVETVKRFMPTFFSELLKNGEIDGAVAVARGSVRDRFDWWAPVLFMCLKRGQLWDLPEAGIIDWEGLINNIKWKSCIPVIGPGLTEPIFGRFREIARKWAEEWNFPLANHHWEDLPQVAQFMASNRGEDLFKTHLRDYLCPELLRVHRDKFPGGCKDASFEKLFTEVAAQILEDESEPHRVLAGLQLPVYITTNHSNLLAEALKIANRNPEVEICRWNKYLHGISSIFEREPDFEPSEERPLVYHLFGNLDYPKSLVLTQNDYFDFLIRVMQIGQDRAFGRVKSLLITNPLLFLGYQLDDWSFRVLYRIIENVEGKEGYSRKDMDIRSVAVQLDPEGDHAYNPEGAREYLKKYFKTKVEIDWRSLRDFMEDLQNQCKGEGLL